MIQYVTGDATHPEGPRPIIIPHVCNDSGGWGAGFVLAVSRRWPEPEAMYRKTARSVEGLVLGSVQFVEVAHGLVVANMVAQVGYGRSANRGVRLRYEHLRTCLHEVADTAILLRASVHMPRIGTGLAGGEWSEVEKIIAGTLLASSVPVTVYDLPGARRN